MDHHSPHAEVLGSALLAFLLIVGVSLFYVAAVAQWPLSRALVWVSPHKTQTAAAVLATSTPSGANLLFVGDMFFDRHIRQTAEAQGGDYLFSCIDPLFRAADLVVGNLEGPITTNTSVSVGTVVGSTNNYRFTFPTSTAALLFAHGVRAVSLGNNHIENFGNSGLVQTQHYLQQAGVGYFGGVAGNEPVYEFDQGGVPLALVGYNQFGGAAPSNVAATIATEKTRGRTVIVFAHWGTEYSTTTKETRPVAVLFAKAGASVIIGSHPHVVGVHEYIGTTLVYYSLGNFMFDQYFSKDVMHGLALMLHIAPNTITATEYPTELERDGRTCPVLVE